MSSEAKIWLENGQWNGIHDGICEQEYHKDWSLSRVIIGIESCRGYYEMHWELREYPDGLGLVGYDH